MMQSYRSPRSVLAAPAAATAMLLGGCSVFNPPKLLEDNHPSETNRVLYGIVIGYGQEPARDTDIVCGWLKLSQTEEQPGCVPKSRFIELGQEAQTRNLGNITVSICHTNSKGLPAFNSLMEDDPQNLDLTFDFFSNRVEDPTASVGDGQCVLKFNGLHEEVSGFAENAIYPASRTGWVGYWNVPPSA